MKEYRDFNFHGYGGFNKYDENCDLVKKIIDHVCHDFIYKLSIVYNENLFMPSSLITYNVFISRYKTTIDWIYLDRLNYSDEQDLIKYERDCIKKYIKIYFPKTDPEVITNLFSPGEFPFFVIFYNYNPHNNQIIWFYRITR